MQKVAEKPIIAFYNVTFELVAFLKEIKKQNWEPLNLTITGEHILEYIKPTYAIIKQVLPDEPICIKLQKMGCIMIRLAHMPHPLDSQVPPLFYDLKSEGVYAAEYFVKRGYKSLAFMGRTPLGIFKELSDSFLNRAKELGCQSYLLQYMENKIPYTRSTKQSVMFRSQHGEFKKWMKKIPKPLAIATFNDFEASKLCDMCRILGYSVPDTIAVLGRGNNINSCECTAIPISSTELDDSQLVLKAIEMLKTLKENGSYDKKTVYVIPRGIVTRASTDIVLKHSELINNALRYIRSNIKEMLTVPDIIKALKTTRRKLEYAFQKELNCTINTELQRIRMLKCCEVLKTTNMKCKDVALNVGFNSNIAFSHAFKKYFKMTPGQYRKSHRK